MKHLARTIYATCACLCGVLFACDSGYKVHKYTLTVQFSRSRCEIAPKLLKQRYPRSRFRHLNGNGCYYRVELWIAQPKEKVLKELSSYPFVREVKLRREQ